MKAARILKLMFSAPIARSALKVAAVVGTVLNLINNGALIWAGQFVDPWRLLLNFLVPFCVASYSAARNEATRERGD